VEVEGEEGAPATAGGPAAVSVPGSINSRQDVVKTLGRICDFYAKTEPSSPVPLLLKRAQRMAEMNFLEIISELTPDSIGHVQMVTGVKAETPSE
jgi:type VI secretion system protein ImpA